MQRRLARRMAMTLGISIAVCCTVNVPDAAASRTASPAEIKQLLQLIKAEEARPVGQPLPDNLTALNSEGETVRLRDVLHGPAIVIKTESGCPPCGKLLESLHEHGAAYSKAHGVQLVVLNTASPDDPTGTKYPQNLPDPIVTLHRSDMMLSGFLGGGFYPYLFFFDRDLDLVGRRVNVLPSLDATLAFPKPHQAAADR